MCAPMPNASAWAEEGIMFANTNLGVLNLAFPDVCISPVGIPIPFPNLAVSLTHIPSLFNVIIGGGLAENLLTEGTVSLGDAGAGVASGMMMGPDHPLLGSFKTIFGVCLATRLTTLTIQNLDNAPGISLTPAQIRVLLVS
jgi:hypothetical protein